MNWAALVALIQQGLDGAQLSAPQLAQKLADAAAKLPPGSTQDEINDFVQNQVGAAFSPENIAAAQAKVYAAAVEFFKTGSGPVQKSPTDLVG